MGLIVDYDLAFDRDSDRDLFTYVALALLSKGRARPDDPVPDPTDLGGWWADFLADIPGDLFGSRLWTLTGRGMPTALELAPAMVQEALACGVEDGLYLSVEVIVEAVGPGVMAISVQPLLPSGKVGDVLGPWYVSA